MAPPAPAVRPQQLVRVAALAQAFSRIVRSLPADNAGPEELVYLALRLALLWEPGPGPSPAFERAVQLGTDLARLCAAGVPLRCEAIAAALVAELPHMDLQTARMRLGDEVAALIHDIQRVRTAPSRLDGPLDDVAGSTLREWCIAFNDVRACVVEVVRRWHELRYAAHHLPAYEQQHLALEALQVRGARFKEVAFSCCVLGSTVSQAVRPQVYAPLGHALGLGPICAAMEDLSFQVGSEHNCKLYCQ
jgi:hypothetical protein